MLFGCSSSPEDISFVSDAGFDYVELPGKKVITMEEDDFSSLYRKLQELSLPALFFNSYCSADIIIAGPKFDRVSVRSYAEKIAERGSLLGIKGVGIGSPNSRILPQDFSDDTALSQLKEFLNITTEILDKKGITVALEPLGKCFCNFINSVKEASSVLTCGVLPQVTILPDFYNMEHEGEADMDLSPVIHQTSHIHISDDQDNIPTMRSYLKEEKIPIHTRRIQNLLKTGYDKTITLEIDVPVITERARKSLVVIKTACN